MISIVVQCIGIALLMMSTVVQCIGIALLMISIVVQCLMIALLMMSIVVQLIAYDEHSCAMLWDCIKISIVVQCIRNRHWN